MIKSKANTIENFREFVIWWNNEFPIDYWWRKKYGISFNSEQHRNSNLIDIRFELEEERYIPVYISKMEKIKRDYKEYKEAGTFLTKGNKEFVKMTDEEIDEIYDKLDEMNL